MGHLVWLEIAEEPIGNNGSSTFLHFSNPISLVLYLYRPNIGLGILVWEHLECCPGYASQWAGLGSMTPRTRVNYFLRVDSIRRKAAVTK